jgi:ATP/maltotriose-dependent transcriptional regulator MalT
MALTVREREVLGLLASGCSNREIASTLFVSLPTVKTHLAHIYDKLDARNRNEALGRAMTLGLLP